MQIERITHNPAVMGGKPCIRGLLVTVETILGLLASGKSRERILQAYPYLEPEDIDAALAYGASEKNLRNSPLSGPLVICLVLGAVIGGVAGFWIRGSLNEQEVIGFADIPKQFLKLVVWAAGGAALGAAGGAVIGWMFGRK